MHAIRLCKEALLLGIKLALPLIKEGWGGVQFNVLKCNFFALNKKGNKLKLTETFAMQYSALRSLGIFYIQSL